MNVMILGASGLTGGLVLEGLLATPAVTSVVAPVRRPLALEHSKLSQHVVDFDALEAHAAIFHVDAVVCCLGTTIHKAGSRDAFRKVDHDYALAAARLAKMAGARAFILMSAVGASATSSVFYSRVKGELEDAVRALRFAYLAVYHPSLLLGDRDERRTAESLGMAVMPLANYGLIGPLKRYRAISAETVASAMVNEVAMLAENPSAAPFERVLEYADILDQVRLGQSSGSAGH